MKAAKKIEHWAKAVLDYIFEPDREKYNWRNSVIEEFGIRKILFLRNDRLGDLIISEPVFRNLKQKYPSLQIDVLLSKKNISAESSLAEYVDNCFCLKKDFCEDNALMRLLRKENYDLVVDLMDKKSTTSAIVIKKVRARFCAGFDKENALMYNFIVPRLDERKHHIVERTSNILRLFGIDLPDIDLHFNLQKISRRDYFTFDKWKQADDKILGINMSGSNISKYWGESNYCEFIDQVAEKYPDWKILLLYTKDYSVEAKNLEMASSAKCSEIFENFNDYAACIANLDLLLTPDTAAVHLASAFKTKCIVLYNQNIDDKNILMPWFPHNTEYMAFGSKTGNLSDISPEKVFRESQKLFSSI